MNDSWRRGGRWRTGVLGLTSKTVRIYGLDWTRVPNARAGDDVASYLQREGGPGAEALKKAFDDAPLIGRRIVRDVPQQGKRNLKGWM